MNKNLLAGLIVVGLIAIGVVAFIATSEDEEGADINTSTQQTTETPPTTPANETSTPADDLGQEQTETLYKAEEVATRNTESECWTVIDGMVYDITEYLPRHPGGNTILQACGTDGTSLFTERTTQEGEPVGSGTPHSSNAASQLADLKIGILDTTEE